MRVNWFALTVIGIWCSAAYVRTTGALEIAGVVTVIMGCGYLLFIAFSTHG